VKSGNFGTIEKACFRDRPETCFGIKYVSVPPGKEEDPYVTVAKRVLEHEIEVMVAIKDTITKAPQKEIPYHYEQYLGSLLPDATTPWLFTEFIEGVTLSTHTETPEIQNNVIAYYFQTLLLLEQLEKLLPNFVHGDLNPGNIMLVKRDTDHSTCKFQVDAFTENGNYTPTAYTFDEPYYIKLIDFGLSECDTIRWGSDHPSGPSESILGVWQLDAFMALESFLPVASLEQGAKLRSISQAFFGEDLTAMLGTEDSDIYRNIGLLKELGDRSAMYKLLAAEI
jgi:serine/threonine protein kinase